MSLNLPICHACNTTLSRKQRRNITENVTNPPYLGGQLKKCDHLWLSKKFWTYMKCLKQDRPTIGIPTLKMNGRLESDNTNKANILNAQF